MRLLLTFSLLISLVFFSCRKDDPPILDEPETSTEEPKEPYSGPITDISQSDTDCFYVPGFGSFPGPTTLDDTLFYLNPCINPNDDNEFIYIEYNTVSHQKKLMKYDLSTQNKSVIQSNIDTKLYTNIDWKGNKIVYINGNNNVVLQNDDGSNSQIITSSNNIQNAVLDDNLNKIYWTQNSNSNHVVTKGYIIQTGNTITYLESIRQWLGNNQPLDFNSKELLTMDESTITTLNIEDSSSAPLLEVIDFYDLGGVVDVNWSKTNDKVIYFSIIEYQQNSKPGILKLDFDNNKLTRLTQHCPSLNAFSFSVSSNDEFLLAQKNVQDSIYDNQGAFTGDYQLSKSIYKINLNILEETKINL